MKKKLLAAFLAPHFFCTIVFTALLLIATNTPAQTASDKFAKPKAILVAEWSNSSAIPAPPVKSSHLAQRVRIVDNQTYHRDSPAKTILVGKQSAINKIAERFASFKSTLIEEQVFALVNKERSLQNLQMLEWDSEMFYLAREHSKNMAQFGFFSHQRLDGKTISDCSNEIGATGWTALGENLAFSQGVKDNAEFSLRGWMNSASHKRNLLDKKWIRSGIGVAQTPDGKFYITQIFRN